MTTFEEGELRFEFAAEWHAERFDVSRSGFPPKGVSPVDFVVESEDEIVLVEIKDPSAAPVPDENRDEFVRKMKSRDLTHQELVPKARTSYGFLHLMARDTKRMRYLVVIGTERLSMQPPLLMSLTAQLRKRLGKETDTAWKRRYISDCIVVPVAGFGQALHGCSARRIAVDPEAVEPPA